ncbi:MAG: ribosome silencing factor [Anaerotruncus sp.]|jgi:ribosome-associated protein|nr:ribosome silencing factor [Anaerotruncus sp.]
MTSIELANKIAQLLDSKKATDIMAIEIKDLTTIGDYFVIASSGSTTQTRALSDAVEEGLSALGLEPNRIEGYQAGMWVVLDYSDVIVHIFYEQTREFYALERLWADAPRVQLELAGAQ